ncbi:Type I secretion target repeat protein [Sulfitobacter donghicola DSW-25 = KCTC 12864 = JCM 14565]|nr:Type I secretion target repeat protein [Sulfitobacter donghicola DSW-25 = KCTC 12864 = JCM 14565]
MTVFDSDDNLGVGDDQIFGGGATETGAAAVIQSLSAGAPSGWNIGDTFYFGGSRGIESGSGTDDYLIPKVAGTWQISTALYSLPGASIPLVVGETYTRLGDTGNVDAEVVPCFTTGTKIKTLFGEICIENLEIGDRVLTLDCGYQPVRWVGCKTVLVSQKSAPICFFAGSIGNEEKLLVSPNHRMLIRASKAEMMFGASEVLIAAKYLTMMKGVSKVRPKTVTYVHVLFDQHQIIHANGALSESFHPGPVALAALESETRQEVLEIFPELANRSYRRNPTVRMCLRPHEIKALQPALC